MKKIVDVNYLRDNRLKEYLEEEKSNFILFTDYACMESFKGQSLVNIKNSLEIVSEFSEQVLVLKNIGDVIKEDLSRSQENDLFIDHYQTGGFRDFCLGVKEASEGNSFFARQLLEKSELASLEMEKKKEYASLVFQGIEIMVKELDENFVKTLRTAKPWSSSEYEYAWRIVVNLCKLLFEKHNVVPIKINFIRHYIFRNALASCLLAFKWIGKGGWQDYPIEQKRNDLVYCP